MALASLAVVSVVLTTLAVAAVARALVPEMPTAAAVALGAIVSPPDAAAATAVLRQLRPPHRILTILEGESLLNDGQCPADLPTGRGRRRDENVLGRCPTLLAVVAGSVLAGVALAWLFL